MTKFQILEHVGPSNFASKIFWLATKFYDFTDVSTLKVFSSYFNADSNTNTVISDMHVCLPVKMASKTVIYKAYLLSAIQSRRRPEELRGCKDLKRLVF